MRLIFMITVLFLPFLAALQADASPTAAGDGTGAMTFSIKEGITDHFFYQDADFSFHVITSGGKAGRIYGAFPGGNSGVALQLRSSTPGRESLDVSMVEGPSPAGSRGGENGARFRVRVAPGNFQIFRITMDSIRAIRDLDYPGEYAGRVRLKEMFLKSRGTGEAGFTSPIIAALEKGGGAFTALSKSLDGRQQYKCIITPLEGTSARMAGDGLEISTNGGGPALVEIGMFVSYRGLHSFRKEEILSEKALGYGESLQEQKRKRFDEALQALRFLSYREKILAGSWRYLTYFGRDTMMTLMLLKDSVTPRFYEAGLQSVIDRLSGNGEAAHEEDVAGQAEIQNASRYLRLLKKGDSRGAAGVLAGLDDTVYDYKMIDDDFMLPIMLKLYLEDDSISLAVKKAFLEKKGAGAGKNMELILQNFEYVLQATEAYSTTGQPIDLIAIREGIPVGNWRDSSQGLGWGRYPLDVNSVLVPESLKAIRLFIKGGIISRAGLLNLARRKNLPALMGCLESDNMLQARIKAWEQAAGHFQVILTPAEVRERLKDYLEKHTLDKAEREYLLGVKIDDTTTVDAFVYGGKVPPVLEAGLRFHALSLDSGGKPVEVINSDPGFILFLGEPSAGEVEEILTLVELPYPLGLSERGGMLVANSIYSPGGSLWKSLDRNAYHGAVVWSWQMALMAKGLERQIGRFGGAPQGKALKARLFGALEKIHRMQELPGGLSNSELWTNRMISGQMTPVPFGADGQNETESNPVQLWSTVAISTMRGFDEVSAMMRGAEASPGN